jgi:nucleoid-associated protein YgaU
MDRGVRISIAATIFLVGATLALLSRRGAVDPSVPVLPPGEQLILRDPTPPRKVEMPPREEPQAVPPRRPSATVLAPLATPHSATLVGLAGNRPAPRPTSPPVRHRIVDGDTLPQLAQRYLGSAERQGEIFEANRGVLSSPDLLPIGAMLKIPAPESNSP